MCSAFIFRMTEFGWGWCWSVWKVDLCSWNCHVGHFSEFGQLELWNGKRWRLSPDSVTQTTEAASSFETMEHTHHATWRKNLGDCHLSNTCHENLKTYTWHYINWWRHWFVVTHWTCDLEHGKRHNFLLSTCVWNDKYYSSCRPRLKGHFSV